MKRALKLACVVYLMLIGTLSAEPQVNVAVFPFSIQAEQGIDQARDRIKETLPLMLKEKLEKDGVKVVFVKDSSDKEAWDYSKFRQEGIKLGVDKIITGNIFIAGQRISIDAQMHNIYEKQSPLTFFSQAKSIETLYSAVTELGKDIIGELYQKKLISNIVVVGNKRVEADAISRVVTSKPGDIINPETLSTDLALIYKMGFFDNVVVKKNKLDRGVEIVFEVTEKPSVRNIKFKDNSVYKDEELFAVVDTSTGSILNIYKINNDVEKIKRLYTEKNYHNCTIAYEIKSLENDQADIVFAITEGDKIKIETISFEGNQHFKNKELLKVMETSEKGFWSFLTSSGELDETKLDNDVIRIESLYKNNGFIDVKVSDAQIDLGDESIAISFKIEEGNQYKTGIVDITGDILTTREELLEMMASKESDLYNRELIRKDMLTLTDLYSNQGYANVNIAPLITKDEETKSVNLSFKIAKGELVYFNRIIITGNSKTRDKVIRREMAVKEQGLFSMTGIQRSHRNLGVNDFFQTVDIKPVMTDQPNQRNLEVNVTEKATGNFTFGGGFSSDDGPYGQVSLEERNLFGRGQNLKVLTKISSETALYNISFTEPWLFDMPVSAGTDLYRFEKEYDYYDRDAFGLTLRAGYRQLWDYTAIGLEYNIEDFEIYDVQTASTNVTPGQFLTSSLKPYISYDSRNHYFLPTEGALHKFSVQYAGEFLGGEIDFTKYRLESGIFFPLFWKFTGALHAKGGYLDDRTEGSIDIDWERFYLGGINSIRGFDNTDINAQKPGEAFLRGGEKFVQFNAELIFPIEAEMGVMGVLFYDRGDVYTTSQNIDITDQFSSAGFELRWNSPMGPIRLAYGFVLDGKQMKETGDGQFDFSIGAFF
ncbi:MAG: outer membrane protein assembly factor BamA [Proteobacteria bacterium]|nr:outer membrane protein assembly factor BamA [Desulfobacula sp.]MBU3952411.1 outer membrane protein assembly factor BamA [Pseudomonadota bacterium]MBU4131837.1 outer membrane protein assembly factor BamA [Pseudomonadota bacterium]